MQLTTVPPSAGRRWQQAFRIAAVAAIAAVTVVAVGFERGFTAGPSAQSAIVTIDPARILDTREPIGVPVAAAVGPDTSITVQVAGVGGVPANATGVVVTLTATEATADTFVTATPTGTPRAATSVLNPGVTKAIANTITIGLGTDGKIDLYNKFGNVHLIADVSGYLVPEVPRVEHGSIELTAYNASTIGVEEVGFYGCIVLGDHGEVLLDVPLEHGSAITSVTFHFYDDDAAEITFLLHEIDDHNGVPNVKMTLSDNQVESGIASGWGDVTMTPVGADKVSGDVRYVIDVVTFGQSAPAKEHSFCGATVNYARVVN